MVDAKQRQVEQIREKGDFTCGNKLMEEHLYNPFIRCSREDYFKQITGE